MTITTQQTIRKGLTGAILVLACIGLGCSHSSKEVKPTTSHSSKEITLTPYASSNVVKQSYSAKKAQSPERWRYFVHKVRWPGETLSVIAMWYTGNFRNWTALAKANPKLNPNCMLFGDELIVPADLLKTRRPMPKEFVAKATSKAE
jgi:hypothetical protein